MTGVNDRLVQSAQLKRAHLHVLFFVEKSCIGATHVVKTKLGEALTKLGQERIAMESEESFALFSCLGCAGARGFDFVNLVLTNKPL